MFSKTVSGGAFFKNSMSKPLLIDTHAHVNFNTYKDDGDEVIKRTLKENIWLINVGAQYSTSQRAVQYAEKYNEGVYAAVGIHPSHIHQDNLNQDTFTRTFKVKQLSPRLTSSGGFEI